MKLTTLAFAASMTALMPGLISAQDDYVAPRTEYGQPDLQGVWNFSSFIPLQRPALFADKKFLTDEDVAALAAQTEAGLQAINNIGVGGYNTFWIEMGGEGDNRTSLITYPENGRLPETVEGVAVQVGGLGPDEPGTRPVRMVVGGIAKDGPEDRGISERCLVGFNAGPPFTPNLYNNNVQIVQNRDTVVIMTERFTRVDAYTVNYEFTIDDPSTFKDKITAMVPMAKVDGLMYEYACHEGNYGMLNTLRGARMEERRALEDSQ